MTDSEDRGGDLDALRARLATSRAALLRAMEEMTERDFAAALDDGRSVVQALAELAAAERADVAADPGKPSPPAAAPEKPLPPQVVHDLAGARHRTEQLIAAGAAPGLARLVDRIAQRESAVADRIEALKRHG